MPHGQHRIAVQTGSTAHFAFIKVQLRASPKDGVTFACSEDEVRGWSEAIADGARAAVAALRDRTGQGPTEVVVERFTGLAADTDDQDAYAAALMATLKAGLAEADWPTLRKVDDPYRWSVLWP